VASEPVCAGLATVPITAVLEDSRAKVAILREEERKTLRRELHDEVLPWLAVVRHRVSAARLGSPTAEEHLTEAESTINSVVLQLRTLARSLRPPAHDEKGLVGAIGHFTASMRTRVEVEIATDAVALHITVANDGMGIAIPAATSLGMGLAGIRERAAEPGGYLERGPRLPSGTRLHACLPDSPAAAS
jgi:signal transduction histidine kinase